MFLKAIGLVCMMMMIGVVPVAAQTESPLLPLTNIPPLPGWHRLYPSGLQRDGGGDFVAIYGYAQTKAARNLKLDLYARQSVKSDSARRLADMTDANGCKYLVYSFASIGMFFVYAMSEDKDHFLRFMLETNTKALADQNVTALTNVVKAYKGK